MKTEMFFLICNCIIDTEKEIKSEILIANASLKTLSTEMVPTAVDCLREESIRCYLYLCWSYDS